MVGRGGERNTLGGEHVQNRRLSNAVEVRREERGKEKRGGSLGCRIMVVGGVNMEVKIVYGPSAHIQSDAGWGPGPRLPMNT